MALNLEKQLLFVSLYRNTYHSVQCLAQDFHANECRSMEPITITQYAMLFAPFAAWSNGPVQVNVAIHITCVPILLFTGIALVRIAIPSTLHSDGPLTCYESTRRRTHRLS